MSNLEQTLSIIKPDAVERNLVEEIKNIFKKNGDKYFHTPTKQNNWYSSNQNRP